MCRNLIQLRRRGYPVRPANDAGSRLIAEAPAMLNNVVLLASDNVEAAGFILRGIKGIATIVLEREDIVRHRLVQNIVDAYERHE